MAIPVTPVKKPRRLTTKQRKFVQNKAAGMTGVAAAQDAYGVDYRSANVIAVENMQKLTIKEAIESEFEKQGLTPEKIIKPIMEAMEATQTVIVRDKSARRRIPGESDEAYEERQTDASFIDERPDYQLRLKAVGMAAQFLGIGKTDKADPAASPTTINFNNFSGKTYVKGN